MVRRWYLDLHPDISEAPMVGDVLVTGSGEYPIIDVWPTESRVWSNRWTLTLADCRESCAPDPGRVKIPVSTYRRGEGPEDFFGVTADGKEL